MKSERPAASTWTPTFYGCRQPPNCPSPPPMLTRVPYDDVLEQVGVRHDEDQQPRSMNRRLKRGLLSSSLLCLLPPTPPPGAGVSSSGFLASTTVSLLAAPFGYVTHPSFLPSFRPFHSFCQLLWLLRVRVRVRLPPLLLPLPASASASASACCARLLRTFYAFCFFEPGAWKQK